jgi:uncharacterized protein (TIGR04255 family)
MPFDLSPPVEKKVADSPLALVVCQVRFEELVGDVASRQLLGVYRDLGAETGPYPLVDQSFNQTLNVQVGDTGVQSVGPQSQSGWRLSSRDGSWNVYLMPSHLTLETTAYTAWRGDFRERFEALLTAVVKRAEPQLEQRLGLRYVNRITKPSVREPAEWRGYIADEMLGPILHAGFGVGITATQQQLDLDAGGGVRCILRHGFFADQARSGAPTYLLDLDVYRKETRGFDQAHVLDSLDGFNNLALQLFQASVTPRMLEVLNAGHTPAE